MVPDKVSNQAQKTRSNHQDPANPEKLVPVWVIPPRITLWGVHWPENQLSHLTEEQKYHTAHIKKWRLPVLNRWSNFRPPCWTLKETFLMWKYHKAHIKTWRLPVLNFRPPCWTLKETFLMWYYLVMGGWLCFKLKLCKYRRWQVKWIFLHVKWISISRPPGTFL